MPTDDSRGTATYASAISARANDPILNDFLHKLLTLDAALIGGGFVVAKGDVSLTGGCAV